MYGFDDVFDMTAFSAKFSENVKMIALVLHEQVVNISENVTGMVEKIVPVALPVLGIAIAVFFGVKFIRKVVK